MKRVWKKAKKILLGIAISATTLFGLDIATRQATQKTMPLPPEYIAAVKPIFGDKIDYSKVRIMFGKASRLQFHNAMTIGNTIYYADPRDVGPDDLFTHEMTHIWQQQNKIKRTGLGGVIGIILKYGDYNKAYAYEPDTTKRLTDYNLEQQGEIVEGWVRYSRLAEVTGYDFYKNKRDVLATIIKKDLPLQEQALSAPKP